MAKSIRIRETGCSWGTAEMTLEEDDAMHDEYEIRVAELVAARFPGVELDHRVQRRASGGDTRIAVWGEIDPREEEAAERTVLEILGRAWEETCEASGGNLYDLDTAEVIREATIREALESVGAARRDGGAGVIRVDGRRCYVAGFP